LSAEGFAPYVLAEVPAEVADRRSRRIRAEITEGPLPGSLCDHLALAMAVARRVPAAVICHACALVAQGFDATATIDRVSAAPHVAVPKEVATGLPAPGTTDAALLAALGATAGANAESHQALLRWIGPARTDDVLKVVSTLDSLMVWYRAAQGAALTIDRRVEAHLDTLATRVPGFWDRLWAIAGMSPTVTALARLLPSGVLVVGTDGLVHFWNGAALSSLGLRPVDLYLRRARDLFGNARADGAPQEIAIEGRRLLGRATMLGDGSTIWLFDAAAPLAEVASLSRMATLGTAVSGMIDDMVNPLAGIVCNLAFIRDELGRAEPGAPAGSPQLVESLREAQEATERVRRSLREAARYARAGEPQPALHQVNDLVELALNVAYGRIRPKARLVKDLGRCPIVLQDEPRLAHVIVAATHALAESLPAGHPDNFEIRVSTRTESDGFAAIELRRTALRGAAGDTSPGEHALELNQRLGADLGVQVMVAPQRDPAMQMIVLRIPPAQLEKAQPAPAPPSPPQGPRARVLVIDDEPLVSGSLKRALGREHDVVATNDPSQAVAAIAGGERYDVILCDIMMPTMTGVEVYERIEKVAQDQALRIVFVSGAVLSGTMRQFLEKVPNLRIGKPFDLQQIRAIVARHSENRSG
jgi:CheY-like chemotaxis protein/PAS domain-containing protein